MAETHRPRNRAKTVRSRWHAAVFAPTRIQLQATGGPSRLAAIGIYRSWSRFARTAAVLNATAIAAGLSSTRRPHIEGLESLAELGGIQPDAMSVMHSSQPNRFIVGFAADRALAAVAKVGNENDVGLRRETEALRVLRGSSEGVIVPRIRWAGEWNGRFALVTDAVGRAGRRQEVSLDKALAICLILAETIRGAPVVHGDLTPWNLLCAPNEVAIIDWEESRFEDDPLFDLAHFVIQQGILLRRFTPPEAARHLAGEGSVGWRYLEARNIDPRTAREYVGSYLRRTQAVTGWGGFEYRLAVARILFP